MARVYQNAVAPEAYELDVTPGVTGIDLSTVTAGVFHVRRPDLTTTTWPATLANQTATTLRCTYTFLAGDVAQVGTYVVWCVFTVPTGTVRSRPRALVCKAESDFT